MKHLFFLMAVFLIGISANAQQPTIASGSGSANYKIMDTTITGVATPFVVQPIVGNKGAVTFHYAITKTSGTVAGTIALYGSIDAGATYALINSYTLTDATAATYLTYTHAGFAKYKVLVTTSGTQVANYKIWTLYRAN